MRSDLDAILADSNLDAILVVGPAMHNPAMVYLTGGGHVTHADLIQKRGEKGTLFFGPMERDEAAKTGLNLCSYSNYPFGELLKQAGQDRNSCLGATLSENVYRCRPDRWKSGVVWQRGCRIHAIDFRRCPGNYAGFDLHW